MPSQPAAIFISYCQEDQEAAFAICAFLEQSGVSCWIAPRNIPPGADYAEEIISAIEGTSAMILVLSAASNRSRYVHNEVERAVSKGKAVVPVRLEDVRPSKSLELFISSCQWVDAYGPPESERLVRVVTAIQSLLGQLPVVSTKPADAPQVAAIRPRRRARRWLIAGGAILALLSAYLVWTFVGAPDVERSRAAAQAAQRQMAQLELSPGLEPAAQQATRTLSEADELMNRGEKRQALGGYEEFVRQVAALRQAVSDRQAAETQLRRVEPRRTAAVEAASGVLPKGAWERAVAAAQAKANQGAGLMNAGKFAEAKAAFAEEEALRQGLTQMADSAKRYARLAADTKDYQDLMQQYTADQWQRVGALLKGAEADDKGAGAVAAAYTQAGDTLEAAWTALRPLADSRRRFRELLPKADGEQRLLARLAPDGYTSAQDHQRAAQAAGVSIAAAGQHYEDGIKSLESAARLLAQVQTALKEWTDLQHDNARDLADLSRALPKEWEKVTSPLTLGGKTPLTSLDDLASAEGKLDVEALSRNMRDACAQVRAHLESWRAFQQAKGAFEKRWEETVGKMPAGPQETSEKWLERHGGRLWQQVTSERAAIPAKDLSVATMAQATAAYASALKKLNAAWPDVAQLAKDKTAYGEAWGALSEADRQALATCGGPTWRKVTESLEAADKPGVEPIEAAARYAEASRSLSASLAAARLAWVDQLAGQQKKPIEAMAMLRGWLSAPGGSAETRQALVARFDALAAQVPQWWIGAAVEAADQIKDSPAGSARVWLLIADLQYRSGDAKGFSQSAQRSRQAAQGITNDVPAHLEAMNALLGLQLTAADTAGAMVTIQETEKSLAAMPPSAYAYARLAGLAGRVAADGGPLAQRAAQASADYQKTALAKNSYANSWVPAWRGDFAEAMRLNRTGHDPMALGNALIADLAAAAGDADVARSALRMASQQLIRFAGEESLVAFHLGHAEVLMGDVGNAGLRLKSITDPRLSSLLQAELALEQLRKGAAPEAGARLQPEHALMVLEFTSRARVAAGTSSAYDEWSRAASLDAAKRAATLTGIAQGLRERAADHSKRTTP